jgi:head-tail adaptor
VRAGLLKYHATLQQPVKTRGANGEVLTSWETVAKRRCSLRALRGSERQQSGNFVAAIQNWLVRFRYDEALSVAMPEWRIVVEGRTLRVRSVENKDDFGRLERELHLYCEQDV